MLKRIIVGLCALLFVPAATSAFAQGISQKVAVCNPGFTSRCVSPDASGNTPVVGTVTVVPSGTQDVNITKVGGNAVTTSVPINDNSGSLTVDTLQLPSTLGVKTAAASLSIAPASDSTFPITDAGGSITVDGTVAATQSGTWNITNISGTISLPTGAATSANQTTANASLSSIDTKLTAPLSVGGSVASGASDSGNPVKTGCVYNATQPTVTTGQRVDCQSSTRGEILVAISNGASVASIVSSSNDAATSVNGLAVVPKPQIYNGTSWDRQRSIQGASTATTGLGVTAVAVAPAPYARISTNATTAVKSGAGELHSICINTKGATANTATVYDNTAGSGTIIAVVDTTSNVGCLTYNLGFATGLTIVTATGTAPDMTVTYR